MNYEFLKRLFTSCSDEGDGRYEDGRNLQELYEQVDEVATAARNWGEVRGKAALDLAPEVTDAVEVAAFGLATAYEQQGFINGFRLCAQMRREQGRNPSVKYGKIMAGGNLENILSRMVCCCAVLNAVRESDIENPLTDALAGASDLLGRICDDFEAEISDAEDYAGGEVRT